MNQTGTYLALAVLLTCALSSLEGTDGTTPNAAPPALLLATPGSFGIDELPGAAPVSMLIQNHGRVDDRLLGGSTPAAALVEIHMSELNHGTRKMKPAEEEISIPAGGTLILEPASGHLMLIDLRNDLIQGRTFPLTLHFAQAGDVEVTVRVRRKVDAAGLTPIPAVTVGDLTISFASAPPAMAK